MLMFTFVLISAAFVALLAVILRPNKIIPGAISASMSSWFIGHTLHAARTKQRYDWMHENAVGNDYKPIQYNILGLGPIIQISDPRDIEFVHKTGFENLAKGWRLNFAFKELLGEGIFNVDGSKWRAQRKLASFAFTSRILKDVMIPVFCSHAKKVIRTLDEFAEKGDAVDVQNLFARYTIDSFFDIGLGVKLDSLDDLHANSKTAVFSSAFDEVIKLVAARFNTSPLFVEIARFLQVGDEAKITQYLKIIDDFVYGVIDRRILEHEMSKNIKDGHAYRDLIALFIEQEDRERDPAKFRIFLRDLALNFIVAGRDTTAVTLTWALYELIQNEDCQAELLKNLPPDSASLEEFYKFIGDDKYLNAFIWEVLRLHPPVPADTKIALNSFKLPSGLEIPKDTTIGWITYSLGRRESVWGNDALKFKPTRWIEQSRELFDESKLQYIFPVFNAGYRTCLGKNMAFFEAKLLLVMIAKKFKFQVVHHQREISYHPNNVTLWMKDPFMVFVRKR